MIPAIYDVCIQLGFTVSSERPRRAFLQVGPSTVWLEYTRFSAALTSAYFTARPQNLEIVASRRLFPRDNDIGIDLRHFTVRETDTLWARRAVSPRMRELMHRPAVLKSGFRLVINPYQHPRDTASVVVRSRWPTRTNRLEWLDDLVAAYLEMLAALPRATERSETARALSLIARAPLVDYEDRRLGRLWYSGVAFSDAVEHLETARDDDTIAQLFEVAVRHAHRDVVTRMLNVVSETASARHVLPHLVALSQIRLLEDDHGFNRAWVRLMERTGLGDEAMQMDNIVRRGVVEVSGIEGSTNRQVWTHVLLEVARRGEARRLLPAGRALVQLGVLEALPVLEHRRRAIRGEPARAALDQMIEELEALTRLPRPASQADATTASLPQKAVGASPTPSGDENLPQSVDDPDSPL